MDKKDFPIAVIANTGLGDAIIFETLSHILNTHGWPSVLYSDFLYTLRAWYPNTSIRPYPKSSQERHYFANAHEFYVFQEYSPLKSEKIQAPTYTLGENYRRRKGETWLDQIRRFVWDTFQLDEPCLESGIKAPEALEFRRHKDRLFLHPSSLKKEKNWPRDKFIQLACRLRSKGFNPVFCSSPEDKVHWDRELEKHALSPMLAIELTDLASLIYESGFFIGNDAGIGHLAAAMGLPSLRLFDRKSRASFWSGGWKTGRVCLPYPLICRSLRKKYWKHLLTVNRVERAFLKMGKIYGECHESK